MFNKKIIVPEIEFNKLQKFIKEKELYSVIFNDNISTDVNDEYLRRYIESDRFLNDLTDFIIMNKEEEILDFDVEENIFFLLNHIRYNKQVSSKTNKEELIHNINELVNIINNTGNDNSYDFYKEEYYKRVDQKRSKVTDELYDEDFIYDRHAELNYSLSYDYYPIKEMIRIKDDEEFNTYTVPFLLLSDYYINTLNALFQDMPALYSDKKFLERAKYVLENSLLLISGKECYYELDKNDRVDGFIQRRIAKTLKKIKRINR